MNIVIIVGHPASGFEEVESQLRQCGVKEALPSQLKGMLPKDVSSALCLAHQVPALDSVTTESGFRQIEVGVVWHGLALDLLLGNLEQELWGWSDSSCIFLLDYWGMLDSQITFILVYDEPQRALAEAALHKSDDLDEETVHRLLANWVAYNGAMLEFFLRNPERCLLVHAQQVHRAVDDSLAQLRSRLKAPIELAAAPLGERGMIGADLATYSGNGQGDGPLPQALRDALVLTNEEPSEGLEAFHSDPAQRFIIQGVLSGHPDCLHVYGELQSVANLPLVGEKENDQEGRLAWRALVGQRQFAAQILGELLRKYQNLEERSQHTWDEHHSLQKQFLEMRGELENSVIRNHDQSSKLQDLQHSESRAEEFRIRIRELQEQAETTTEEIAFTKCILRHIQDELESTYQENLSLRESSECAVAAHKVALDTLRKNHQDAETLVEVHWVTIQEFQARSKASEEGLAARQGLLGQTQDELKAIRGENRSLRDSSECAVAAHKAALDTLRKNHQNAETLVEEQRVALQKLQAQSTASEDDHAALQDLLGQVQDELKASRGENGSLRENSECQASEHKAIIATLMQKLAQAEKDFNACCAGAAEEKDRQWHALQDLESKLAHELIEKEELANHVATSLAAALSADRVKHQLSYRLGSTIVSRSRSLSGWIGMPFAIVHTVRDFNRSRL